MIPFACPICNSILIQDNFNYFKCMNNNDLSQFKDVLSSDNLYHYIYNEYENYGYALIINTNKLYKIYNDYTNEYSTIRLFIPNGNPSTWFLIAKFHHNFPINLKSINRFFNLKAFL